MAVDKVVTICRDVTCSSCSYPETYYEVDFSGPKPTPRAIGCRKCGWRVEDP